MHVRRLRAKGFKRFHDLTIALNGTPGLVILCGPNGNGKSSVIDAFRSWHGLHGDALGLNFDPSYHQKAGMTPPIDAGQLVEMEFVEPLPADPQKILYARSAYRHDPDFTNNTLSRAGPLLNAPHVHRMIDGESKVSDNYQRIVSAAVEDLFNRRSDGETGEQIRERLIGRVRAAVRELFPELVLQGVGDPMAGGTFYFEKNGQGQFHYKNLSGGEKAAFDLVLDLVLKAAAFDDTVFCIDEPELHLNTRLQADLLVTLRKLLPPNGQLWVATHSIGMMRAANKLFEAAPEDVAFIDFENHDFERELVLEPILPDREFWSRVFKVALDDLAGLVAPERVVLCEGRPQGTGNPDSAEFDARCYRRVFAAEFPRTDFLSVGNADEVQHDRVELGRAIQTLVAGTQVIRLIDRDLRSPRELDERRRSGFRVLRRRHLESYLVCDETARALAISRGQPELAERMAAALTQAIADSVAKGGDPDNMKDAASYFAKHARSILNLQWPGNTTEAFLIDTLLPLVVPGTTAYEELKVDVFA